MNERTKQLWAESQQWNGSDDGRGGLKILESVEKFAEMIVEECASIVEDAVTHREPASTYVDKIKEHFGVIE